MENSNLIFNKSGISSYELPKSWGRGDIKPFALKEDMLSLMKAVSEQAADKLDYSNWAGLYQGFHEEIESKSGVVFVPRAFNISADKHSLESLKRQFLALCNFFGTPVKINKANEVLKEIKNTNLKDTIDAPVRGHLTNQSLAFHSDRADMTAILCVQPAESGGEFKIASSAKLYEVLKNSPEILKILSSNIPHDLRDEGAEGQNVCEHPIVSDNSIFWVRYIRKFVESSVRHGVKISSEIISALNHVDSIINAEGFSHEIAFQPGDMIIFNNHLTLHSRNSFVDSESATRCLLRVWLSSAASRPLPESLKPIFHDVSAGAYRGGIKIED